VREVAGDAKHDEGVGMPRAVVRRAALHAADAAMQAIDVPHGGFDSGIVIPT
jgi:hypothetical protein